eukprot:7378793-Prymnesium_polylepis.1
MVHADRARSHGMGRVAAARRRRFGGGGGTQLKAQYTKSGEAPGEVNVRPTATRTPWGAVIQAVTLYEPV